MKKIIIGILLLSILTSCGRINYPVPIKIGDKRITETEQYVITEVCSGTNGFGHPFWDYVSIERKTDE